MNLIYRRWMDDYVSGRDSLDGVRGSLVLHFSGEVARRHWVAGGEMWRSYARVSASRRLKRFVALTDEVYRSSVASGPAVQPEEYFSETN